MRRGLLIFVAVLVVTGLVSHLLVIRACLLYTSPSPRDS